MMTPRGCGPRYKQLGNSMAVNKMRWLGERLLRFMPEAAS
jgi:site-specific DNA-cytosine methylase